MAIILMALLVMLSPVLQPFFIAGLIAYLSNPLVDHLERIKVPRILGVIIVFFIVITFLTLLGLVFIPVLIEQINLLLHKLPEFFSWLQVTVLPWIGSKLGSNLNINFAKFDLASLVSELRNNQDVIGKIVATLTTSGFTIVSFLFQLILIPVVTFYLLRDWNVLLTNIRYILPRAIEPTVVLLARRYNEVLRAFIRGQLLVMCILGGIYTIGLWIIGLQFAVLIGVMAGLFSIVPYLGFTTGFIAALLGAYYQFHSLQALLYVAIVFLVGQSVESMVLTPLLVGDSIGLHPVAVIFAVLTGGYYFGLIGALIALPVAAAIMVLMRYGLQKYYHSSLYT